MPQKENCSGGGWVEWASAEPSKEEDLVGVGWREPGQQRGHSDGSRAFEGETREGVGPSFLRSTPPSGVSRCASPAERRPLCSSNMICNFRQTFEVPDICIMWASLLATGNSCLAFPRLNCNYTRSLPGEGEGEGDKHCLLAFSNSFSFYSFPASSKEARDSGWARLFLPLLPPPLLRLQMAFHPDLICLGGEREQGQHQAFLFLLYLVFVGAVILAHAG